MSEAIVSRLIRKVETLLLDSGVFQLPGKKQHTLKAQVMID